MTSEIAVVQWTAAGQGMIDPDGICFHTLVRGGPDTTARPRGEDILIPRLPGMQQGLWEANERTIEFRGWVCGSGADEAAMREDYWDNKIFVANLLPPTAFIDIVITLPGGAQWGITARPQPIPGYREIVPSYGENSIEFESVDPNWTAVGS